MSKRQRRPGSPTRRKWTCPHCGTLFEWVTAPKCLKCGFSVDGRQIQTGTDFGGGLLIGSGDADDETPPLRSSGLVDPYDLDEYAAVDEAARAIAFVAQIRPPARGVFLLEPTPVENSIRDDLTTLLFVLSGAAAGVIVFSLLVKISQALG